MDVGALVGTEERRHRDAGDPGGRGGQVPGDPVDSVVQFHGEYPGAGLSQLPEAMIDGARQFTVADRASFVAHGEVAGSFAAVSLDGVEDGVVHVVAGSK
ncbi:MAG: hypothetical protein M5U09_14160 [Gammaproteobacteria bacterium]|nr:hypothetical protein [Gammaproteobacteria bacterium]